MLPQCGLARYVFTDLSQAFLTNARNRFSRCQPYQGTLRALHFDQHATSVGNLGARFPFIEYAIFNGDKHPGDQAWRVLCFASKLGRIPMNPKVLLVQVVCVCFPKGVCEFIIFPC